MGVVEFGSNSTDSSSGYLELLEPNQGACMHRSLALAVCAAAFAATPGVAQAQNRGFAGGLGGITFVSETSSVFAAQAGVRVARQLVVFGEVGRMQNVLPGEIQDQIDEFIAAFEADTGVDAELEAKVPAFYGMGGIRWSNDAPVAPFVEAAMGFARLTLDLRAVIDGVDVSDQADELLEEEDLDETKFLLAFGGGVNARLAEQVRLDIGYRYKRVFTEDPAVNTSEVFAAIKFWF
jgi:opacity protein-like surface antigen